MKIALLTRRYPPLIGGAEKVLSYLAPALAEAGAEVTVLTARLDRATAVEERVATHRGSCAIERLPSWPVRMLGTARYMVALERRLRSIRPDVAYVSMLKHDAYVALRSGRALGFPVVLRPEGAGATGDLAWQARGRFGRRIGELCRGADAVVAISGAVRAELLEAGYAASRIVDLPNGVPVPAEVWQRRPGWQEAPRAAYVGRLAPEKGVDVLLEAWPLVRREHPAAELTLIGEGPERPALEARVRALGLSTCVRFTGLVTEAGPLLRAADLFVLPSREEGMSIALLEAMALGIPVVVSSIPGNRKLIADFKHGRLAPVDDPTALARTMSEQWASYDRAIHMGRAARSLVEQKYAIGAVARRHLELFRSLVQYGAPPAEAGR